MSIRADSPHAVTFLMVTLFMDTLGFGLIIPVLPGLLTDLSGGTVGTAAAWGGGLMFVYATMRFLFSPVIGNLSDRFGRRPILLVSLATLRVKTFHTAGKQVAPEMADHHDGERVGGHPDHYIG